MVLKQDDLEILERRYAMYILLALEKNPMSTKTEIMRLDSRNEKTKFVRIQELMDAGLIEYRTTDTGATKINLSAEGESIVKKIKKIRLELLKLSNKNTDDEESE